MTLEQSLKNAAYKIWDELTPHLNQDHHIFSIREEGLTSMALKELSKSACPQIIKIEMISAKKEKSSGYDFELVIGNNKRKKYVRFFIQSKKLNGNKITNRYDSIDKDQTNSLINFASTKNSLPTFGFYNHLIENDDTLKNHFNSLTKYDKRALGITLTLANNVNLNGNIFSNHHNNNGIKFEPIFKETRNFPNLFSFNKNINNLAVPLHELAFLTISSIEKINKIYRKNQAKGKLNLLLLLLLLSDSNSDGDLVPIIKKSAESLGKDFLSRALNPGPEAKFYQPQALIIIETEESN